jgi:predicted O-methyltransferase YrrM
MSRELWTTIDRYVTDLLVEPVAPPATGLPPHEVSPPQGALLELLARATGARRILEIGTLGGYSTSWLARALPPVIVADNVVRDGAIIDADDPDPSVRGVRAFLEALAAEPRLRATVIQTVGAKGHDGFALAVVGLG